MIAIVGGGPIFAGLDDRADERIILGIRGREITGCAVLPSTVDSGRLGTLSSPGFPPSFNVVVM